MIWPTKSTRELFVAPLWLIFMISLGTGHPSKDFHRHHRALTGQCTRAAILYFTRTVHQTGIIPFDRVSNWTRSHDDLLDWTLMTNDIRWGSLPLSTTRTQTVRCSFPFSSSFGCCCQWTGNDGWPKLNRIAVLSCPDLSNWWPIRNKCDSVLCEERTSSITCHKAATAKDEEGRKSRWFIALRSGFQSCHTKEEVEKERTSLWYLMFTFTLLDFAWLHGPSSSSSYPSGDTRRGRGRVDWWPAGQCGALGTIHYKFIITIGHYLLRWHN